MVLNLIKNDLVLSAHDVSSGGIIVALSEMSLSSNFGAKIEKPKKIRNLFEYFFGEYQGWYILEIEKDKLAKALKILNDNKVFSEIIGKTQKGCFELPGELKINLKDLYSINNKWYHNY